MQALTSADSSFFAAEATLLTRRTARAQYPPSIRPDQSLDGSTPHFHFVHTVLVFIRHVTRVIVHSARFMCVFPPWRTSQVGNPPPCRLPGTDGASHRRECTQVGEENVENDLRFGLRRLLLPSCTRGRGASTCLG